MTARPHDALFKAIFSDPKHAADELRHALDAEIGAAIDWDSLEAEPGTFVDAQLADQHSDLLFSANAGDSDVLVYLLFEHQSTAEPGMPLRLLGYMHRIWSRWNREYPGLALPPIIPVVLAQVQGGWCSSRRFSDLFSHRAPAVLLAAQPNFEFAIDDLGTASDDDLRTRALEALPKVALWVMRDARDAAALLRGMWRWAPLVRRVLRAPNGRDALLQIIRYVALVSGELRFQTFHVTLNKLAPGTEELTMTIAEELRAEGRTEGLNQGRTEGRTEGRAEGRAQSVLLVLEARGLAVDEATRTRVTSCTDIEQLDRWLARAATVADSDALFER